MNVLNIELPVYSHEYFIPEGPKRNEASKHLLLILGCMVYRQAIRQQGSVPIEALLPPEEIPNEYLVYNNAANDD